MATFGIVSIFAKNCKSDFIKSQLSWEKPPSPLDTNLHHLPQNEDEIKAFFKYELGYVNIDGENIYLTSSGNWSECRELKEKGAQKQKWMKKIGIYGFLMVTMIVILAMNYFSLISGKVSLLLIVGFPLGLFIAMRFLSTELGSQFKLPIAKITQIEIIDRNIHLDFLDAKGKTAVYSISRADDKGLMLMTQLKGRLLSS